MIALTDFPDHPFLIAKSDQVIRNHVRATGQWEPGLAPYLGELLPSTPRIVIGGGHVGLMAFQLWQARPDAKEIVVYEPESVNSALLALNILSWGESPVRAVPVALSSDTGLLRLARNPVNSGDNRLWDAIPADLDAGGGDPGQWSRQTVLGVALDDVWDDMPLDLLLLDAQGWEPEILRGATRVLTTKRPLVLFEWWPAALAARGVDLDAFLSWIERDLCMSLSVLPPEASGLSPSVDEAGSDRDLRRLTELLLLDPDPVAFVEVLARPEQGSPH